jgi:hypothetical protein
MFAKVPSVCYLNNKQNSPQLTAILHVIRFIIAVLGSITPRAEWFTSAIVIARVLCQRIAAGCNNNHQQLKLKFGFRVLKLATD